MAKKKKDDMDMEDDNLDFGLDEFFPLDGDFDKSEDSGSPTFKSYAKNLLKTAKFGLTSIAKSTLPAAVELVSEIGVAKDTALNTARDELDKLSDVLNKRKNAGKGIKETIASYTKDFTNSVKKAVKTGDFTLGIGDVDMSSVGGDLGDFEDVDSSEEPTSKTTKKSISSEEIFAEQSRKNTVKSSKIAIALEKSSQAQNAKLYNASMSSANAKHLQTVGYLSSIDTNIKKIARYYATIGSQGVAAQIEFSQKNLALQQDTVKLLNTIREQTYTPPNDEERSYEGGLLSSIFGNGLDGGKWMEHIISNAKDTVENSPIGAIGSLFSSGMGMGAFNPKEMAMQGILGLIPNLLLKQDTKMKLGNLNSLIPKIPGILNAKLNQLAMTSDNPILRTMGSFLGVKELSSKKIDLGVKDLNKKANFDKKFYHTITDVVPGLLSKILASQTGTGEIFYDFKSGTFKKGEQAVREYKYARSKAYESSFVYNEMGDKVKTAGLSELKKENLSEDEYNQKSEIMRKDFKTIMDNIANTNSLFDPKTSLKDENYQNLISQGVIDKNNFLYFVKVFGEKLNDKDKMFFAQGSQEVRQNIGDFYRKTAPEMIKYGSGGSIVADELINERMAESERILKLKDVGKFYDKSNPVQRIAKLKYLEGKEEQEMKYGGRAGTIQSTDISTIGEASKKGVVSTQLGVLNNIYELLLGGILVYPKNKVPDHLLEKIDSYNLLKKDTINEKQEEIEKLRLRDEELSKSRREQSSLQFKTKEAVKDLPRSFMYKWFGPQMNVFDDFRDKLNSKTEEGIGKLNKALFNITYGKNEKSNNEAGYQEELIESVKDMSSDMSKTIGDLLGKRKRKEHVTKNLIQEPSKEETKLDESAPLKDKIKDKLNKIFSKLTYDAYTGSIDYSKLGEMIKEHGLGGIDESLLEVKPTLKTIAVPEEQTEFKTTTSKVESPVEIRDEKITTVLENINQNIAKNNDIISSSVNTKNKKVKSSESKKDITSIQSSGSIVASIDAMHNTNKEFFKTVLDSGILNIIKTIGESNDSIKTTNKSISDSMELVLAKMVGSENRQTDVDPRALNEIQKKHGSGSLIGRLLRITKKTTKFGISRAGDIVTGITKAFKELLPGLGKGVGGLASGYGKIFSALVGAGIGGVKTAGKAVGGVTKGIFNKIFKRGNKVSKQGSEETTNETQSKTENKPGFFKKTLSGVGSIFKGVGKGTGLAAKGTGAGVGLAAKGTGLFLKGLGAAGGGILSGIGSLTKHLLGFDDGKAKAGDLPDADEIRSKNMSVKDILIEMLVDVKNIRHHVATSRGGIVSNLLGTLTGIMGNAVKLPTKLFKKKKQSEEESTVDTDDGESFFEENDTTSSSKPISETKKLKEKKKRTKKKPVIDTDDGESFSAEAELDWLTKQRNKSKKLRDSIFKSASDVKDRINKSEKVKSIKDGVTGAVDSVKETLSKPDKIKSIKDRLVGAYNSTKEKINKSEKLKGIKAGATEAYNSTKDKIENSETYKTVKDKIEQSETYKNVKDKIEKSETVKKVKETLSKPDKIKSIKEGVTEAFTSAKDRINKSEKLKAIKAGVSEAFETVKTTAKDVGNKMKESGKSLTDAAGGVISDIKNKKKTNKPEQIKPATSANVEREGSLLDQRKDKREALMLQAEISMDKNISKILKLLTDNFGGFSKKKKKETNKDEKKEGLLEKAGSGALGLVAGTALLGAGAYQSIFGKSKLNKKTGIDEYGTAGDKMMSHLSLDASSEYGFNGEKLSFGERSAQSTSLTHAPQAFMTAKAMYKGSKKIGGIIPKAGKSVAKAVVPKIGLDVAAKTAAVAKNIPKSIIGIFTRLFSAGPIKKIVSSKMANAITGSLSNLLKPAMFKGIGSKIAKKIASLIGPIGIGMTINDFITGMDSTNRFFSLGKGAKPSLSMRVISGVVNVLSSFLFGLIPANMIVKTLYSVIGSKEDKEYIEGFNKFTEQKASILDVPAGPFGEYETKNLWQKAFGSEKRDAGILRFGSDKEGVVKYKEWRDEKYKPVEELRQKIANQYGGDKVVGAIPSTEAEKGNQQAYREKFLSLASDLVKSIEAKSETVAKEKDEKLSETKESPTIKPQDKEMAPISTKPDIIASAAGAGVAVAASGAVGKDGEGADVSIPEGVDKTSEQMKSSITDANKINNSVGLPPISNVDATSGAVATAGISTGLKKQEIQKINKDDFKITPSDQEEKKAVGSPVVSSFQNMTSEITTELDALKAINAEQSRHNLVSEEFFQNAIKLMSLLVETGKNSFDLDKSRNEILAKNLLVDIDPKYKNYMRKNTDTSEMRDNKPSEKEGKGFMNSVFGNESRPRTTKNNRTSQISLGPNVGDNVSASSSLSDKGEKSYKPSEVDLSSYVENMFTFDDQEKGGKQADNLSSMISDYKKENPISNKVMQNVNNKVAPNYIQDIISGTSGTHELYETNIPVIYKNKRIGLKNIYIPRVGTTGTRAGDVIIETKFVNGDKQYSVDNSGESTMSLNIDYSKGKFGKGTNSVILNMNIPENTNKAPSLTSKLVEIVSNGGR